MPGFQFTDEEDPEPSPQPAPAKPQPARPQPEEEPLPPSRAGNPDAFHLSDETSSPKGQRPGGQRPPTPGPAGGPAPAGRPVQPQGAPRPGQPPQARPGTPPSPGAAPQARPGTPPSPGAAPQRTAPKYGEGAVPATPGAAWEGSANLTPPDQTPTHAPIDKKGQALYEMGEVVKQMFEGMSGPATWVLRVACAVGALCLAYIVMAYFGGAFKNLATNPNRALITKNLGLCAQGLSYSLIAAYVMCLILGYEDNRLGAIGAAVGVALHFGAVPLMKIIGGQTAAAMLMSAPLRNAGFTILIIGLIRASIDLMIWLVTLPEKVKARANVGFARPAEAKQQAVAREANMFSPCWKLPFCREVIRKQCPAFLAKKTCWKFGRGCYCDEEMIGRIIRGESLEVIKAPTRMTRSGKPPCGRCYIFLEHQTHKFRMLSPLALPATILAMFVAWPFYITLFGFFNKSLDSLWKGLSFNPQAMTPDMLKQTSTGASQYTNNPYATSPEQTAHIAMYMLAALLGFFLLVYISKGIEWAIYKAKL